MLRALIFLFLLVTLVFSNSKPMESLANYNVILIHGAADGVSNGFKCNDEDAQIESYNLYNDYKTARDHNNTSENPWQLGNAPGMVGSYSNEEKLTNWLDSTVFEDKVSNGSEYIYIQRSFSNPAGSPKDNGDEVGNPAWSCGARRSLIEEAQEIKSKGRANLEKYRIGIEFRDSLPPSRNIIVAHSMGGVASREYVQGGNYNGDVDKVITLDSPHEGTGSLNTLIDMRQYDRHGIQGAMQSAAMMTFGVLFSILAKEPYTAQMAAWTFAGGLGATLSQRIVTTLVDAFVLEKGYDYKSKDPLMNYIVPESSEISDLMNRAPHDSLPMFRLLYGYGSLAFSDPNKGFRTALNILVPEAITMPILNAAAQMSGSGDDQALFINTATGIILGTIGGLALQDVGTTLIPEESGKASSTKILNNPQVDVKRKSYRASVASEGSNITTVAEIIVGTGVAIFAADVALSYFFPQLAPAVKGGLVIAGGTVVASGLVTATTLGVDDIMLSHEAPIRSKYQSNWKGDKNTYSLIEGGSKTVEPYLMEDFLYEKPFVNLAVKSENDFREQADSSLVDSLGLYGSNDSSLVLLDMKTVRARPLSFSNAANWEKLGVKLDRWERVDGLDASGARKNDAVPIRHVERYEVPGIVVSDWIEKYSFIVDDLMPHRLRQIRISFNFQEDVAWECDVEKDSQANDNCQVYKRTSNGEGWKKLRKEKHPVNKNGVFRFAPRDYGYDNLLAVQKDNQNTVTVSTVNKTGLSNSQRFYYLFKATDNLFVPEWPLRDIKITQAADFSVLASALDYQGFSVVNGKDAIAADNTKPENPAPSLMFPDNAFLSMNLTEVPEKGSRLTSAHSQNLTEGHFVWRYRVQVLGNNQIDSTWYEDIPFTVDRTPPEISLSTDSKAANPDSGAFLARFTRESNDASLRALRLSLSRFENGAFVPYRELKPMFDVISPEFALNWEEKESLADGYYQLNAFAIDEAYPGRAGYDAIHALIAKSSHSALIAADWAALPQGFNTATASAEFFIDRTAPQVSVTSLTAEGENALPAGITLPPRQQGLLYLNQNELLNMAYTVRESLLGRDSTPVKLAWRFEHIPDTLAAERTGDSVWVTSDAAENHVWKETGALRFPDGDYRVRLMAQDAAGNASQVTVSQKIRVDRTAPQIHSLFTNQLTYTDSLKDYRATMEIRQSADADSNKSVLRCYYRINSGDWNLIDTDSVSRTGKKAELTFALDPSLVGNAHGKRYLEAGCADAAGNFGTSATLFYIGERLPVIVSPDSTQALESPVVAIYGIAPASAKVASDSAVYRLRYRANADTVWHTAGMDAGAGKRFSASEPWISNGVQPTEGLLGLWDRGTLDGSYVIELGVRSCNACAWVTDSMSVYLGTPEVHTENPVLVLSVPDSNMVAGVDTVPAFVHLTGANSDYRVRLYAEDASGMGLFELSADKLRTSPYKGSPADPALEKGIWFYGENGTWHLTWRGISETDTLRVLYKQSGLAQSCQGPSGELEKCLASENPFSFDPAIIPSFSGISEPELMPLTSADHEMKLFGEEGHLVIRADSAFQVNLLSVAESSLPPVYFGENAESGLPVQTVMTPVTVWTVDPLSYALGKRFDGLSDAGAYPASGIVNIYAEAIENKAESPRVFLDSIQIRMQLPPLEIVSRDTALPKFHVFQPTDSGKFVLGNLSAAYGIRGRTAKVSAFIVNPAGDTIKTLFTNRENRPGISNGAYSVSWDGTSEDDLIASQDRYSLVITARESNPENAEAPQSDVLSLPFALELASGLLRDTLQTNPALSGPFFAISEAKKDIYDPGKWRYEPVADYLVKANLSGYYLPESLRTVTAAYSVGGTQNVRGYTPERFSLGIKRQREQLDLVIVYKVDRHTETHTWDCDPTDNKNRPYANMTTASFNSSKKTFTISINQAAGNNYGYRYEDMANFNMIAVLQKDWEDYRSKNAWDNEKTLNDLKDIAVWRLSDITGNLNGIALPRPKEGGRVMKKNESFGNCVASLETDSEQKSCEYGLDVNNNLYSSDDYNPNLNLFDVTWIGTSENNFYENEGEIKSDDRLCDNERFRTMKFTVNLTIPDSYWNAGFGYDNLVNRTIRFDHTNKTIFGSTNGYLKALKDHVPAAQQLFYNGSSWSQELEYGLLTPFETHRLPFVSAEWLSGGLNTFLFPDETPEYQTSSYFDVKFYGAPARGGEFMAEVSGLRLDNHQPDTMYITSSEAAKRTPLLIHGTAHFHVGVNQNPSVAQAREIAYPVSLNWINEVPGKCAENYKGEDLAGKNEAPCQKYYALGSKAHYHNLDYNEADWNNVFLKNGIIRNPVNSPEYYPDPNHLSLLSIDPARAGTSAVAINETFTFPSSNYQADTRRFFLPKTSLSLPVIDDTEKELKDTLRLSGIGSSDYTFERDTLFIKAREWSAPVEYRRTLQGKTLPLPVYSGAVPLSLRDLYRYQSGISSRTETDSNLYFGSSANTSWTRNDWIKGVKIEDPKLTELNDSLHSHFEVSATNDSLLAIRSRVKPAQIRPSEFVELRGRVGTGKQMQLAYLKDSALQVIEEFTDDGVEKRLAWFDVNKLQGNTSFIMLWGGGDHIPVNYTQYDLLIGSPVQPGANSTIKSLFGEISVSFPQGAVDSLTDVTVRTADAREYNFNVFNNAALTGPVMEVQPSMNFEGPEYPRIQTKISRQELETAKLAPDRVRLYKVDFENEVFVPLNDVLYGYLKEDGSAVGNAGAESASCTVWNDPRCYSADWAYLLLSAQTKTFSVFAVLDSVRATHPSIQLNILPEIGTSPVREVRVSGTNDFNLYADNDSLWNDVNDSTPAQALTLQRDSLGSIFITLPNQSVSWIFMAAKKDTVELASAPVRVKVRLVPASFVCEIPRDTLYLGLDNGYLSFAQNCNAPGLGILMLTQNNVSVAEIRASLPDTIFFDGRVGNRKIPNGTYGSRYLANSLIDSEIQMAGATVITDSLRPQISGWNVSERGEFPDMLFEVSALVSDRESGLASAELSWILGSDTLGSVSLKPDSAGNVSHTISVPRKTLTNCLGCALTVKFRAEDFGHNFSEKSFVSSSLYPYPTGLALWYPASEGRGNTAHEKAGTDHHLSLNMSSPWLSASGLYFSTRNDRATGAGRADLGMAPAYTLEAWVRPGFVTGNIDRRLMGFAGTNGNSFELQQVNGKDLRLVEGVQSWTASNVLLREKVWNHVAVTADSAEVRFYVNGVLLSTQSGTALERELYGVFSLGAALSGSAFTGHIQDARLYNRALSENEIHALFSNTGLTGDTLRTIIIPVSEMQSSENAKREFSCAVPERNYTSGADILRMRTFIEHTAVYKVVLYARAAKNMTANIRLGAGGSSLQTGRVTLETVWRPVSAEGVTISLSGGSHELSLEIPEGVQVAALALTSDPQAVPARITWKTNTPNPEEVLSASVKFEGAPDVSMVRPRLRVKNISNRTVYGFTVRYYFRGEDPSQVTAVPFFPNDGALLSIHSESANTGYVEWKFPDVVLAPGSFAFYGDGPHFGIYNAGFVPWLATDDPSFVEDAITDFVPAAGIVILDNENRTLAGSCAETEDPISAQPKAEIFARDARTGSDQASHLYIGLQNVGTVALKNYEVRYSFYLEEGLTPIFDVYDMQGLSSEMISLGSGRYQVSIRGQNPIMPGNSWQNPAQFALHLPGWENLWNVSDDPSYGDMTSEFTKAMGIEVFDSLGVRIYGNAPVWKTETEETQNTADHSEILPKISQSGISIPIHLTDEGLVIDMPENAYVAMDLVNVTGIPLRSIYSGNLSAGENFIAVDWSGINESTTYFALRLNGNLISTQKLSQTGK